MKLNSAVYNENTEKHTKRWGNRPSTVRILVSSCRKPQKSVNTLQNYCVLFTMTQQLQKNVHMIPAKYQINQCKMELQELAPASDFPGLATP